MSDKIYLTTGQLQKQWGVTDWQLRRTIDSMDIPVLRAGLYRLIHVALLDTLKAELQRRGYLPVPAEEEVAGDA